MAGGNLLALLERIIFMIQQFPYLYDERNPNYKNSSLRRAAFEKVAAATQLTEVECVAKWKYLRDRFIKEHRKMISKASGCAGGHPYSEWPLYEAMSFMIPFVSSNNTDTYLERASMLEESVLLLPLEAFEEDDSFIESTSHSSQPLQDNTQSSGPAPKRRCHDTVEDAIVALLEIEREKASQPKTQSRVDHFTSFVAETLKTMPIEAQNEKIKKITDVLLE